jgi:ATP-dependent helicase YprA (DUF1998 family)
MTTKLKEVDVVLVGLGWTGGILAKELTAAGHQVVALERGSVAALFEHYLAKSEQIDSRLWLRADGGRACGLLLQKMPGAADSDAATWQRAGRAGRRTGTSCAVLVASSAPLDQYIVQHPDYFFERPPESAHINPDNVEPPLHKLRPENGLFGGRHFVGHVKDLGARAL